MITSYQTRFKFLPGESELLAILSSRTHAFSLELEDLYMLIVALPPTAHIDLGDSP